jgi:hypothetical protein
VSIKSVAGYAIGSMVAACSAALPTQASAAPWTGQPSISLSAGYQSNPSYSDVEPHYGRSESVSLSLPLASEAGRHQFHATTSAQAYNSRGVSGGNKLGYGINAGWSRSAQRGALSFDVGQNRSNLIGSERTDLGVRLDNGYQNLTNAGVSANWAASEKADLAGYLRFNREDFEVSTGSSLVDNSSWGTGVSYSHALNLRTRISFTVHAGRSDAGNTGRSSSSGFQVGLGYQPREELAIQAAVGISSARNSGSGSRHSGATYSLSASRVHSHGSISLAASHDLQTSAFGASVLQDTVSISYSLALSERVGLASGLSWSRSRDTQIGFNLDSRDFGRASVTLSSQIDRNWRLSVVGSYVRSTSANVASLTRIAASSSEVVLALSRDLDPVTIP